MAYDASVRQLLNQKGIDNNRIGWDNPTGTVMVDGKTFMKPQKVLAGTSYTDQPAFNQAYSSFFPTNTQAPAQTPAHLLNPTTGQPWANTQERLTHYAQNPNAGYAELDRSKQMYGVYDATGQQNNANEAHDWSNLVRRAMGISGDYDPRTGAFLGNPYDRQVDDSLKVISGLIQNPKPYDVYSSPEYTAAKAMQDKNANQSIRVAQESLGESGFARSTNLADRAQRIQNENNDYLMTQVIPQLIAANDAKRQQELSNLTGLVNVLSGQQGVFDTREERDYQHGQDTRKWDYQAGRDKVEDAFKDRGYDIQERNALSDNAYRNANLGLENEKFGFEKEKYGLDQGKNARNKAYDYFDSLVEGDDINGKQPVSAERKSAMKQVFDFEYDQFAGTGRKLDDQTRKNIVAELPGQDGWYVISQLESALSSPK